MAGAGPAATTAAYLAMVPPEVGAAAARHAQAGVAAWALGLVGPLAITVLLARSGAVERAWRWGGRRGKLASGPELFPVLMNLEKLRLSIAGALPRRQTGPTLAGSAPELFPVLMNRQKLRLFIAGALPRRQTGPTLAGSALAIIGLLAAASCAWDALVRWATASVVPSLGGLCAGVLGRAVVFAAAWAVLKAAGPRPRLVLGALAAAASFLLVFGPEAAGELIGPRLDPAPAKVAEAAREVARASGVSVSGVVLSPAAPGEGDVTGLFRPARILLRPEAVGAPQAEVRAGVGHVLGHYRARDEFGWALVLAALGVGGAAFVIGLYERVAQVLALPPLGGAGGRKSAVGGSALGPVGRENRSPASAGPPLPASPAVSPQRGESGSSDPRALPVLWALAAAWIGLAQPLAFAWDRAINLRADRFSLEHAREPDGLAMKLVRENGLQPVDPPLIERVITCSHPPLKDRLDQAMRWKADQPR